MLNSSNIINNKDYHPNNHSINNKQLSLITITNVFSNCEDFQQKTVSVGLKNISCTALWIDGVVDGTSLSEDILRPLTEADRFASIQSPKECINAILDCAVYSNTAVFRDTANDVIDDMCHGYCCLLFDDINKAITFEVRTKNVRSISEPTLEKSLKGAKDSFVETLRTSTSLVRRRICSPSLKLLHTTIGRKTLTKCAVMYVDGIADQKIVDELTNRLGRIDIDGLVASGYIEEYIVDRPLSPFPQIIHTERPDRFATQLLNGRVGLLVDGLSIGFLVPANLPDLMRVPQDKSNNYIVATSLSLLRWIALFLSLILPAFFVSVTMYHQEMIPSKLLLSMINAKQDVPFSVAVEVIGMLISFGLLQEAGLRLPNPVGDTVSIIGALIVGQAAVDAKVISPITVIVVALAAICGYTLPSQDLSSALRLGRLLLVIAGILAGLFGVAAGLCILLWYLCSIESFGLNYMSPISSNRSGGLLKALLRPPKKANKYRDPDLNTPDRRRQA